MHKHMAALEFPTIIEQLKDLALSDQAKASFEHLSPYFKEAICIQKMEETTGARRILDICGAPPLPTMHGLSDILVQSASGAMLLPEELERVAQFAAACSRMSAYMKRGEGADQNLGSYGRSLENLGELQEEIQRCIRGDTVCDEASPALADARRKILHVEGQVKEKLNHILKSRKQYLADGYVSQRSGHYVLPVQRKFQGQFGGTVIEASAKGSTVFMEPTAIAGLQGELDLLRVEEDSELRRVLYTLTALVEEHRSGILRNMEAIEILDVLFAKAKLSASMGARAVAIGGERRIEIQKGRHPLLEKDSCVPLDFSLGRNTRGVIITGPNTGGKTVALKTVGLLCLMAQCGLHIPCEEGSYIGMQDGFFCDIGDSQDISQNLSTFSGHMTNVISILEKASRDSLVLLDELGSGTDPAEGMGIAVAVLEELWARGCLFLVTTHYTQVKDFAQEKEGVLAARMAFDQESLSPLYRLELGLAGESCALHIARRLGLAEHILELAQHTVYGTPLPSEASRQPKQQPKSRLERKKEEKPVVDLAGKFQMGDSVVLPGEELGIVYRPADEQGFVVVQVKGEKRKIRHNRLRLKVSAAELYPPDYDFSILFDSVEVRKARHKMDRKFDPSISISYEKEVK